MAAYVEELLQSHQPSSNLEETIKLTVQITEMVKKTGRFTQTPEESEYDKKLLDYYSFVVRLLLQRLAEKDSAIADLHDQIALLLPCVDNLKMVGHPDDPSAVAASAPSSESQRKDSISNQ
jgi:hypothetical protein